MWSVDFHVCSGSMGKLTTLRFSSNRIGDIGMEAFSAAICSGPLAQLTIEEQIRFFNFFLCILFLFFIFIFSFLNSFVFVLGTVYFPITSETIKSHNSW